MSKCICPIDPDDPDGPGYVADLSTCPIHGTEPVKPDGTATVTITFKYSIKLSDYPDNVTTVAQAVEFDHGEFGDDPSEFLQFAADENFTVAVKVDE
jgi:hypothetical protein